MPGFKLLTYAHETRPRAGVLIGETVYDAAILLPVGGIDDTSTTRGILAQWDRALPLLQKASEKPDVLAAGTPLSDVRLKAPILYPGAYYCAASNYYDHAREMNPHLTPTRENKQPFFFLKPAEHTTVGPGEPIRVPGVTQKFDWEIELGAVIGREAKNLTVENALSCVAGYTIVNDLSARDLGRREDWPRYGADWFGQKVFDDSMPMGPWIVPASDIPDPHNMPLKLWVNDQAMQTSSTSNMIFNIAEQIEYLARRMTLRPGDVIATGTPAGVGAPRGLFLKRGDVIRMEIGGIGSMTNPVV